MKTSTLLLALTLTTLTTLATPSPASAQAPTAEAPKPTPKLETLVGFYEIQPGAGRGITVTLEKDTLIATPPNGDAVRLIPKSGNVFNVQDKGITASFTLDKDGKPTEFVMHQDEATRVFTRRNDN